jgi:hypothetical protein
MKSEEKTCTGIPLADVTDIHGTWSYRITSHREVCSSSQVECRLSEGTRKVGGIAEVPARHAQCLLILRTIAFTCGWLKIRLHFRRRGTFLSGRSVVFRKHAYLSLR